MSSPRRATLTPAPGGQRAILSPAPCHLGTWHGPCMVPPWHGDSNSRSGAPRVSQGRRDGGACSARAPGGQWDSQKKLNLRFRSTWSVPPFLGLGLVPKRVQKPTSRLQEFAEIILPFDFTCNNWRRLLAVLNGQVRPPLISDREVQKDPTNEIGTGGPRRTLFFDLRSIVSRSAVGLCPV